MENTKACEICSCDFIPYRKTQKYCPACKITAEQNRKKAWYIRSNPDAYAPKKDKQCVVCGDPFRCHFDGLPYCNKHYLKMKFYGTTEKVSRNKNTIVDNGDHCVILTAKGEHIFIDKNDIELAQEHSWCVDMRGYVVSNVKSRTLHRHILGLKDPSITVDHIDGNKLNNRRSNLRACEQALNGKNLKKKKTNTSGYPGVRQTKSGTYNVRITVNRKEIHVGNFDTFEEAVSQRKAAEVKYYGLYAPSLGTNAVL